MTGQATKRIGVDFDGVLFDQVPHIIRGFRELHDVDLAPVESWHWNLSEHPAIQAAGLTEDQIWQVFRQLELEEAIHRADPLDPHALEVLGAWQARGWQVHIATSRPEHSRPAVEAFLSHNQVPHDLLEMGVYPKTGYDVLVDDLPPNVQAAAEDGGHGLLFHQPYNVSFETDGNPRRVQGWREVEAAVAAWL